MTQSCQIKQRYTFHLHPAFIRGSVILTHINYTENLAAYDALNFF